MGLKRACSGTTRDVVKHRSFDFQKPAILEEAADLGHHQRALHKQLRAFWIAHQVEVPLAVFLLAVGEAVPLVGHRPQGFG